MRQFWNWFRQETNESEVGSEERPAGVILSFPSNAWSKEDLDTTIHLDACAPFERIAVKTRSSLYELIVLSPRAGEVLIRGGRFFPEFRRAIVSGSSFGGSALKMRSIDVGCRMELRVDGTAFMTSTVQALSRQ